MHARVIPLQGNGDGYPVLTGLPDSGVLPTGPSLMWMGSAINEDGISRGHESIQCVVVLMPLQAGARPRSGQVWAEIRLGLGSRLRVQIGPGLRRGSRSS